VQSNIVWEFLVHYTIPHISFCFMINAILYQSWKDQFPEMIPFYDFENLIAPVGSTIVVVILLLAPHSKVCCLQYGRRYGPLNKPDRMSSSTFLTKEEWKTFAQLGE
jgi:hypothetical protein